MRNRYDLAGMARRNGRRASATMRPIETTQALENELRTIVRAVPAEWRKEIAESILPAYGSALDQLVRDDLTDALKAAIDGAKDRLTRVVLTISPRLRDWTIRVEQWHRRRFADGVKAALGPDVFPYLSGEDVRSETDAALERNASLITGLSDDLRKNVERIVWDGVLNQTPRREIAKDLAERLAIGRRRADFIARDQTSKFSSDLDRLRQQQAGIQSYKWRHSGKIHFRPEHKARDGKVFRWDDPPYDGHPGHAPNCGCKSLAFVDLDD